MSAKVVCRCTRCERDMPAYKHIGERSWCARCYEHDFKRVAECVDCGKSVRALQDDPAPRCRSCRIEYSYRDSTCANCTTSLRDDKYRGRLRDGRLCCRRCLGKLKVRLCVYCDEVKPYCQRDFELGFDEPACLDCRNVMGARMQCAGCRRPRRPAGEKNGLPYCVDCLATGRPPIITCAVCKKKRFRFTKTECEDCAWERYNQKLIQELLPTMRYAWVRTLFERYHKESRINLKRAHWRDSLRRDAAFFVALGEHFDRLQELSGVQIVRRLGWKAVREQRRVMSFLAQQKLVLLEDDPDYNVEIVRSRLQQLASDDAPWIRGLLERHLAHLLHVRQRNAHRGKRHTTTPSKAKSLESAVRAALKFLHFAQNEHAAESAQHLTQEILDFFLAGHRVYRFRVASFIDHLNIRERLFHRLKLPKKEKVALPVHLFLPEPRRLELIDAFLADGESPRWSLISLMSLVYGQTVAHSCALPLAAVRQEGDTLQVKFKKVWLDVDPYLSPAFERWLAARASFGAFDALENNPYLFPGLNAGSHVRSISIQQYMGKFSVTTRALRATGLAGLVRGGIKQARVLIDAFGISPPSAQDYLAGLSAAGTRQAKHAFHTYAQS